MTGVAVHSFQQWVESRLGEHRKLGEKQPAGHLARQGQGQCRERFLIHRRDPPDGPERGHDFTEVTRQDTRPAERINAIAPLEGRQLIEAVHHSHAGRNKRGIKSWNAGGIHQRSDTFQRQKERPPFPGAAVQSIRLLLF